MNRAFRRVAAGGGRLIPGVRLIMLGRQGAGKGTQCVRLSRHYVVPHISTGDILRAAVKEGTDLGRKAKEIMDEGGLVPDDIMIGIVAERLGKPDASTRGFVLDGFPRTVPQVDCPRRDHHRAPGRPRGRPRGAARAGPPAAGRPASVPGLRHQLHRHRRSSGRRGSARCAGATWSSAPTTPRRPSTAASTSTRPRPRRCRPLPPARTAGGGRWRGYARRGDRPRGRRHRRPRALFAP